MTEHRGPMLGPSPLLQLLANRALRRHVGGNCTLLEQSKFEIAVAAAKAAWRGPSWDPTICKSSTWIWRLTKGHLSR